MKILFSVLFIAVSFLSGAQAPQLVIPRGHNATVKLIATSPDKKWLATGDEHGVVKLWDMITAREVKTFNDTSGITSFRGAKALTFSPDSKKLFIGHLFNLVIIDLSNAGKEIFNKTIHDNKIVDDILFSSKGKIFATAADEEIKIWDLENLESPKTVPIKGYRPQLAFDDANNIVAVTSGNYTDINFTHVTTNTGYITHVNTATGQVISTDEFENLEDDNFFISPNGKLLATVRFEKLAVNNEERKAGTVQLLDIASKTIVKKFIGIKDSTINLLSFSENNNYMVTMAGKSIILYDLTTLEYVKTCYSDDIFSGLILCNTDGSKLFQAISTNSSVVQWNFKENKVDKIFGGQANFIQDLAITPDQQSIILLSGANEYYSKYFLQKLDLNSELVSDINRSGIISNMQHTYEGGYIASAGGGRLFEADAVNTVDRILQHQTATAFSVSNNKKILVTTNQYEDPILSFYNVENGKKIRDISLQTTALSFLYSKDDLSLYVGHKGNNKIDKIDIQTGTILKTFERIDDDYSKTRSINFMMLSKDESTLIAVNDYNEIYSWNTIANAQSAKIGYGFSIKAIPNKNEFVYGNGESDLEVYDLSANKISRSLKYPSKTNGAMDITADGKFIFYSNNDKSVSIVDFSKGEVVATMVFFGKKDWVIVDKAGRFDGTETGMKTMYYAKGLNILPLESGYEQFYTPKLLQRILNNEKFTPPVVDINNIKAAPVVKISVEEEQRNLSVGDDIVTYKSDKEEVTIKVKADCPDDAVTEIRLYQNGKLVQTTRNLTVEDENKGEKTMTKTFSVTLNAGPNNFKAIAINSQRTESLPAELIADYKPLIIPTKTEDNAIQLYLFVVGVNTYKNPKYTLNYAHADAAAFTEAITTGSQGLFGKINTTILNDADATKEGIAAGFEKIKAAAQPQDLFIFYYAGHGVVNDKKEFFLVPYDVTQLYGNDGALAQKGFSAAVLQQMSKDIKAQKQLFILDACQSAGALEVVAGARGAAEEKAIAQLARSTGTQWLTASGSEQFASEFSQLGHGSFTYCLLQAFKGDANPGDKRLTVKQLDAYLQLKVPEITQKYKGTPQYPASYSYGNDFPIIIIK